MKFTYITPKPLPPLRLQIDASMPIKEVFGVGPGYAFVQFAAVPIQTANSPKYAVGG